MKDSVDQLKDTLSVHMTNNPYDANDNTPERYEIDELASMVRDFEMGDYTLEEMDEIFQTRVPDFDFLHWMQSKVADGTYQQPE